MSYSLDNAWQGLAEQEKDFTQNDYDVWKGEVFSNSDQANLVANSPNLFSQGLLSQDYTNPQPYTPAVQSNWFTTAAKDLTTTLGKGVDTIKSAFSFLTPEATKQDPTKPGVAQDFSKTIYADVIKAGALAIISHLNNQSTLKSSAALQEDKQAFERETKALEYKREDEARARKNRVPVRRGLLNTAAGPVTFQNPIVTRGY